ncbi:MAG: T9SS type B sorting domain-containing protein [Paludibacteraceae bacterium]|nr:T9SS type B sorting domain-containing protein [Paludibacteraceae bacterium]
MKKIKLFVKYVVLSAACLFGTESLFAQWPGGGGGGTSLPLVAETDFSVAGGEDDYYHSMDMVDGLGNSTIRPHIGIGSFSLVESTESDAKSSEFLDNACYAITPNPIRLDSLRMYDNEDSGEWGLVISGGKRGLNNVNAVSFTVGGLKNGGQYKVVVEYCNPLAATYLDASGSNKNPHLTSGYSAQIKIGTNNSGTNPDGVSTSSLAGKEGACLTATVNTPTSNNNTQGPIANNMLTVNVVMSQLPAGQAIMIKSIKVYAEIDAVLVGNELVCAGGETTPISLGGSFVGCTYKWYKDGQVIPGATSTSVSHESGDKINATHQYYCEITTKSGDKFKSNTFTVKDEECCTTTNPQGQVVPAAQKLIWMDDFGTFTSAKNYWTWDYTDISNPKKVNHTDGVKWQRKLPDNLEPQQSHFAVVENGDCDCPVVVNCKADANKFAEGYYTVAANVLSYGMNGTGVNFGWAGYYGDGNEPSKNGYSFAPDHTYMGSDYGAMLFLNVGSDPGAIIYKRRIDDLCDRKITLKCYLNNFSRSELNPISVFLRITDLESGNVVESPVYTRFANTTSNKLGTAWVEARASIELTGTSMLFEIVSKTGGCDSNKDGNDLLLDDIMIYACSQPSVGIYFDLDKHLEETKSCLGDDASVFVEYTKMIETNIGADARYLYQYSTKPTDLTSWKTILGPVKEIVMEDISKYLDLKEFNDKDKIYFRVILGPESALKDPNKVYSPTDPCGNYSVSNTIELTIDCPACTEPKDPVIKPSGDGRMGKDATGVKTVHLCSGESVTLSSNDVTAPDKNGVDYEDFKISWHKESKTSVGLKTVKSGAVAEDLVVSWADVKEEGTSYFLKVHDNFEDESGTTKCDKTDEIIIFADPIPENPTVKIPSFCEGLASDNDKVTKYVDELVKSLSDYDVDLVGPSGDVSIKALIDELDKLEAADSPVEFTMTLTDKATKCVGEPFTFEVNIDAIPEKPVVHNQDWLMDEGKSKTIEDAADAEGANTLEWVETTKSAETAPTAGYSSTVPSVSLNEEAEFYFFVRQVSEAGCIGEAEKVKITVNSSPLPLAIDTIVCVGSDVDLKDIVNTTDDIYELRWYEKDGKPDGTGSTEPFTVKTDKPAELKYYVTQRSTKSPYPESKMKEVKVTVIGVDVPDTTGNTYHYCAGDEPVDLKAKLRKDQDKFYYADQLHWTLDGGEETDEFTAVKTKVDKTTTYEYSVYQSYTINNKNQDVCKGDVLTWNVEVTYVPELETSQVTYMRADADKNGNFDKNLMEQSENGVISGYDRSMNLLWYEANCEDMIGNGKTAPTPKVDVDGAAGIDQERTYCVKQEIDGCLSKGTPVNVIISDAPKPLITDYVYCRGDEAGKLTTKPDMSIKPTATYVLKWYGNGEKNDYTDLKISGDEGPNPTTSMRAGENGRSEYYYYVTQTEMVDGKEGAESNKTEIKVVVYDQPRIEIDKSELKTVCKPAKVDISKSVSLSNEVASLSYETKYYKDATLSEELGSTKVEESGEYQVVKSFSVTAKANDATCVSDATEIPVTIDTLRVEVENVTTCPNMDATFTVNVKTNTKGDVKYTWNGLTESDPNGGISTSATFTTKKFANADYGQEFKYSLKVTAGECSFEADTMKVTLGEGPVKGTMTVTEEGNAEEDNEFKDTKFNEFYSCGGPLTVTAAYVDEDGKAISDYVWYDGTKKVGEGADLNLPENRDSEDKTYRLEFTNGCPTSVTITIHNRPISVTAVSMKDIKLCEGEKFNTIVKSESPKSEKPDFKWYRNGEEITTGGGVSLDNGKTELTIDKVATKHNGRYSVVMTNRGCTSKTNVDSLVAMPYIVATEKIDTIVPRNSNPSIKLDVTVPAGGSGVEYDWKGTNGEKESTNPLVLSNVVADHYYNVVMKAEDHCDAKATVDVKVDAKLTLKTTLKDTICTGLSAVLVIDTTGTGKMRHEDWERSLTVSVTSGGVTEDLTSSIIRDGDMLKLTVSPKNLATYEIKFHYGEQDTVATEVLEVIPAIKVTIPDPVTICAGETADIELTDITPDGTTVRWVADETIVSGDLDSPAITVQPEYRGGTAHQYQYGYKFVATNSFCNGSETMTAYIYVDEPLTGEILGDKVICETFNSRIDASSYSASVYKWSVDDEPVSNSASMVVSPKATTTYKLSMERGVCKAEDEFVLTVKSNPVIVAMDSVDIRERETILKDGTGESPFSYWVDNTESLKSEDPILRDLSFTKHIAHVVDVNGCRGELEFEIEAPKIFIPEYFSPNGDGRNDGWVVKELVDVYPNALVTIYDRFGKVVAQFPGAQAEGWDGTYNGNPLPSTDYWYVIDIEEIDRQFKGHFTLIRQ